MRTWLAALTGFVALAVAAVLLAAGPAAAQPAEAGDPPAAYLHCPAEGPDRPVRDWECGLFVRDPWGAERRLTDHGDDRWPAWSPDGTRLAYSAKGAEGRFANARGYVVGVDGTGTRRIGGEDARPGAQSWSPDGSRLALQEEVDESTTHATFEIDVVDVETGHLLAELAFEQRTVHSPVWSADGTRLYLNARADPLQGAPGDVGPWLMVTDLQGNFRDLHEGATSYAVGPQVGVCPQVVWYDVDRASLTDYSAIPAAHRANVNCAAHHGIVHGFGDGAYRPARDVRRDQMASFLVRAMQFATGEQWTSQTQRFADVPPDNAHFATVNGAAEHGLAAGHGDGTFRPGAGVRRDQTATFAVRLLTALTGDAR